MSCRSTSISSLCGDRSCNASEEVHSELLSGRARSGGGPRPRQWRGVAYCSLVGLWPDRPLFLIHAVLELVQMLTLICDFACDGDELKI
jgi:hypothetical protein